MSFNLDDPLAGILSDGSDDSFFDDDILGKKNVTKKKSIATPEKKNALFDLQPDMPKLTSTVTDIKKDSNIDIYKPEDIKTGIAKPVSPTPYKSAVSKESLRNVPSTMVPKSPGKPKISISADSLDILDEINDTKKEISKSMEKGKSSQSLLDDILGGSSVKQQGITQTKKPSTAAKSQDFDLILGKSESKAKASAKTVPIKSATKAETPTKEDKSQKKIKSSDDWLGIFNEEKEDEDVADMPSWLSGADTKKKKSSKVEEIALQPTLKEHVKPDSEKQVPKEKVETEIIVEPKVETDVEKLNALNTTVLKRGNEDLTAEGAAMYLQQQESQLMVALQLKAQEEKLAAMQMRQKESQRLQREAALAHHDQLDAMLQRQTQHRLQMQAVINAHQERITERIKSLLGTPNPEENLPDGDYENTPATNTESPHMREKKQLLQLVQSLQENHDKEIDLMETSYRRQLAFLEVSLNQAEERMKEDSDKLTKFYSEKIIWLEEHHLLYKKLTEDNLTSLTERHRAENKMLRQQHLENVRVLQEHHAALMENIKNAVRQEQALIQDSAGFSSDLRELVSDIKESRSQYQHLVERVETLAEGSHRNTERSLQARETQVTDMIEQMKLDRENFEKEKTESRDMVNLLEKRLKQMTAMIEDESAALKQKKMEFEFEKATFSKQTEFAKNVLKKQDDEVKMLKEDVQREYQEKVFKINEEKTKAERDSAAISKEKASIQGLKQELEKMKSELQAQLEEVGEERLRINLDKQQMHIEEQRIMAKSRDMDMLAKAAVEKQTQADKKYSEAEFIQNKYEERIRRIQEHVVSLNAREKQIAKEKVALSRERLSLHNERKKVESRMQCSLCKSTQYVPQYNFESAFPESFLNVSVSRDRGDGTVNSAMNTIANEMVNLKMSKNLDLKYRTVTGNVDDERVLAEDTLQTMQTTESSSGAFKDYLDPKFMMLRLDVQQVLSNLDHSKKEEDDVEEKDY